MGDDVTSHVNLSATASVHRGPRRDYYNDSMSCTPTQRLVSWFVTNIYVSSGLVGFLSFA